MAIAIFDTHDYLQWLDTGDDECAAVQGLLRARGATPVPAPLRITRITPRDVRNAGLCHRKASHGHHYDASAIALLARGIPAVRVRASLHSDQHGDQLHLF